MKLVEFTPVALIGLSAFAYALIGWFGIGMIGLAGLVITSNLALNGGHALAESSLGSGDVPMCA